MRGIGVCELYAYAGICAKIQYAPALPRPLAKYAAASVTVIVIILYASSRDFGG